MAHTQQTAQAAIMSIVNQLKKGETKKSVLMSLPDVDSFTLSYLLNRGIINQRFDMSVRNADTGSPEPLYTLVSNWVQIVMSVNRK